MRAVVYQGPRRVEVRTDVPEPALAGPRDAIVRVTCAAICGTDLHPYRGEIPGFGAGTVLGHEFVGLVEEAGPEVPFAVGQRVLASDLVACGRCAACARGWYYHCADVSLFGYSNVVGRPLAGGQADYVRVPYADVVLGACPEGLADEQVLFAGDVLTTGYTAALHADITPGDVVAVVGGGAVGLFAGLCAWLLGAAAVVVADGDERRRAATESLSMTAVPPSDLLATVRRLSGGRGAGAVVEAVGSDAALACALDVAAPRATIAVAGAHHSRAMPFSTETAFARELTVRFVVGDPIRSRDDVLSLVRAGRVDPTRVISHRLPLDQAADGYRLFDERLATKVVLRP